MTASSNNRIVPAKEQYTLSEAAHILDMSVPTLREFLKEGAIDHVAGTGGTRIPAATLISFKEQFDGARATAGDKIAEISNEFNHF